ncbi:Conserved_hypothetical protein [Hexamita inflata]|uniref:Uncharacterized protein n=1 Tax=Hexamita inflata TaxID=28002 RepID=A0AA86RLQ3_9EUKA|nr:Conserved hypothetical protein [Hexamita inflata]
MISRVSLTKQELRQQRRFDPVTDWVFQSTSGQSVTVFNRPNHPYQNLAYNSPAHPRPLVNKINSYYVTNQAVTRVIFILMSAASAFIFCDLVNSQLNKQNQPIILNGPVFAFGILVKYISQLLLTQHIGSPVFDRVFGTIEACANLFSYAAMFASLNIFFTQDTDVYQNVSITVYVVSCACGILVALAPKLPWWVLASIYICYGTCAIIFVVRMEQELECFLLIVVIILQCVGGTCYVVKGHEHNFKAELIAGEGIKYSCTDKSERWWINWKYNNYIGPIEIGYIFIAAADLIFYILLHYGIAKS